MVPDTLKLPQHLYDAEQDMEGKAENRWAINYIALEWCYGDMGIGLPTYSC